MESHGKKGGGIKSARVQGYLDRAAECERMAARVDDLALKNTFKDAAQQWLMLAEQVEWIERETSP